MPKDGAYLSLNLFDVPAAFAVEATVEAVTAAAAAEAIKLRRVMFFRVFISVLLKVTLSVMLHSPPFRVCNCFLQLLIFKGKNANLHQDLRKLVHFNLLE
jgi:hypothetical protein